MTIEQLEQRINELIKLCDHLKAENQALRNQITELDSEQTRLIRLTELARNRIEDMIMRLKSMEQA
ncbi:hypothetical conserved protein [Candidatus Nitrosoglobus terrae]|uniref:Hypothetical conserved protein n=1 Tax=Candidatus Nitrosoglobus terrae TaxID=1630141 RepID=A0A1Q2SKX1_9GAMM|nr:TIGR02449 family protein [Candidatus Nitrosoglobus terrae]BAW79764.1 hypothetical conserved protein [Candidatus Nitrosoglobus terrae]